MPSGTELHKRYLTWEGSLTQVLRQALGQVSVQRLYEGWGPKSLPRHWQRDVLLQGPNQQPYVFARTCVPDNAHSLLSIIQQLGEQPLGDWLFQQPFKVIQREWPTQPPHLDGILDLSAFALLLPGRHNVYVIAEEAFTVTEFFLGTPP